MASVDVLPNSVTQTVIGLPINPNNILTVNDTGTGFAGVAILEVDMIQQVEQGAIKLIELFMRVRTTGATNGETDQILSGQRLNPGVTPKSFEAVLAVNPPVSAWTDYSIVVLPAQINYTWQAVNSALLAVGRVVANDPFMTWEVDCVWLRVHFTTSSGDGLTWVV